MQLQRNRMTLSRDDRLKNMEYALGLMLESLGDRAIDLVCFEPDDANLKSVVKTTWMELAERGLVKERPGMFPLYRLSGAGWLEAMQLTGQLDDPSLKQKAGRLAAALKARVKAREHEELISVTELEQETGISESWIFNAIESHLLGRLFNIYDARWAPGDQMKNYVEIPANFGMPRL